MMCASHWHSCDSDKISYYCSIASATAWKLYKDEIATLLGEWSGCHTGNGEKQNCVAGILTTHPVYRNSEGEVS